MNVLIIDDHHLIRDAVGAVLREIIGPDVQVFEAATAAEASDHLASHPETELVLLDLALPDSDGLDVLETVGARLPSIATVVLSALQDRARIARAFELGAVGIHSQVDRSGCSEKLRSSWYLPAASTFPPKSWPPLERGTLPLS